MLAPCSTKSFAASTRSSSHARWLAKKQRDTVSVHVLSQTGKCERTGWLANHVNQYMWKVNLFPFFLPCLNVFQMCCSKWAYIFKFHTIFHLICCLCSSFKLTMDWHDLHSILVLFTFYTLPQLFRGNVRLGVVHENLLCKKKMWWNSQRRVALRVLNVSGSALF